MQEVKPGQLWRHHTGRIYTVLFIANEVDGPSRYPRSVVYIGPNGKIWCGELVDWHRRMTFIEEN